jgi:hypothetical protein
MAAIAAFIPTLIGGLKVAAPYIAAGTQAYSSWRTGALQRAEYDARAAQERLRGRAQALQYKQQGVETLRRLNENLASTVARAAAGGVDPLSGSALNLQNYAMREGARDYNQSRDNALIATGMAEYQAQQYKAAGSAAFRSGMLEAVTSLAPSALDLAAKIPAPKKSTPPAPAI